MFKVIKVAIASAFLSVLLPATPIKAQSIEWIAVTDGIGSTAVGSNTLVRTGDQITFDARVDKQYVRYNGNCQSEVLYRLKIGTIDSNNQPQNVEPYPNERWFRANDYQAAILAAACEASL